MTYPGWIGNSAFAFHACSHRLPQGPAAAGAEAETAALGWTGWCQEAAVSLVSLLEGSAVSLRRSLRVVYTLSVYSLLPPCGTSRESLSCCSRIVSGDFVCTDSSVPGCGFLCGLTVHSDAFSV